MFHHMRDHHTPIEASMFAPVSVDSCICGAAGPDPVHAAPPCDWCDWCDDTFELGAPAPWWHRMWCRFVTWWLLDTPE